MAPAKDAEGNGYIFCTDCAFCYLVDGVWKKAQTPYDYGNAASWRRAFFVAALILAMLYLWGYMIQIIPGGNS